MGYGKEIFFDVSSPALFLNDFDWEGLFVRIINWWDSWQCWNDTRIVFSREIP